MGYLEESSRKRFVSGMRTESIRERLLMGAELTFTKVVEITQSLETAAEELAVNDPDAGRSNVHRVATPTSGRAGKVACFRCGRRSKDVKRCSKMSHASIVAKVVIVRVPAGVPRSHRKPQDTQPQRCWIVVVGLLKT